MSTDPLDTPPTPEEAAEVRALIGEPLTDAQMVKLIERGFDFSVGLRPGGPSVLKSVSHPAGMPPEDRKG